MSEKAIQVKLAEYKGIEIKIRPVTVTPEEVEAELDRARSYASTTIDKEEGEAIMGDQAVIDFVGYIDGVAFEGGDGEDYPLVLGSNTFIPGFEEQLVGAKVGDVVDVKVPFPENYHAAEYAGKDAIFKVTVKGLRATITPELSDDVVARISPCKTVEEFRGYVEEEIKKYKDDQRLQEKENLVLTKIVEASEIDVPEELIEERKEVLKNNLISQLRNSGNELEAYLDYNNLTEEMFDGYLKNDALSMLKGQAVLARIAEEEGFSYTDEELQEALFQMARSYQMTMGELEEMIGEEGKKLVGEDILSQQALRFIVEQCVEV